MSEITYDIDIIGRFKRVDDLRYSKVGYALYYFILLKDNPKAKKAIEIPCKTFGNNAEKFSELWRNQKINQGDKLRIQGYLISQAIGNAQGIQLKVEQFQVLKK